MESQVDVYEVNGKELEEREEEESLIHKRKNKEYIPKGKGPNATIMVPVEVEKNNEIEKSATPIVFFDEVEGTWKCHHCVWTFQMKIPSIDRVEGHPGVDHVETHRGHHQGEMNEETSSKEKLFSNLEIKGGDKSSCQPVGANGYTTMAEIIVEEGSSQIVGVPPVSSNEYKEEVTVEVEQLPNNDPKEENEPGTKEVDLKKVLEEQNTHDLYCPNCKSCITRRVILRKRKRTVQVHSNAVKREKSEDVQPVVDDIIGDHRVSEESEVFGCFQCFSLFIRTATGFEFLPNIFKWKYGDAGLQDEQGMSKKDPAASQIERSVNCLSFILERGRGGPRDINQVAPTPFLAEKNGYSIESRTVSEDQRNGTLKRNASDKSEVLPLQTPPKMYVAVELHDQSDNAIDSQVSLEGTKDEENQGVIILDTSITQMVQHSQEVTAFAEKSVEESVITGIMLENGVASISQYSTETSTSKRETMVVKATGGNCNEQVNLSLDADEMSRQKDKVLGVQTTPKEQTYYVLPRELLDSNMISSPSSKTLPILIDDKLPPLLISSSDETRVEVGLQAGEADRVEGSTNGWDILKSIVYGGLAESVASLGVITSAAGGDAGTLNIVALGLANLIGGLFVIAHNVLELKEDVVRYTELIGCRQNFWRNTFVLMISYLVFGLVAPITYGFSFRKSDNKEYKIITVSIASLLCILILALGKARVTDRAYIRRVVTHVSLGVSVCGVSYVAGVFIRDLLEKLGWISEGYDTLYVSSLIMGTEGTVSQTSAYR